MSTQSVNAVHVNLVEFLEILIGVNIINTKNYFNNKHVNANVSLMTPG